MVDFYVAEARPWAELGLRKGFFMLPSGVSNVASENLADDTHPAHTINSCFEIDCLTGKCSEKKLKNVKNIKTIFISARSGRVLRGGQGRILIIPTYKSTRMDPTTFHEDSNSRSTIDDTGHNNYSSTLLSLFSLQRVKSELCELMPPTMLHATQQSTDRVMTQDLGKVQPLPRYRRSRPDAGVALACYDYCLEPNSEVSQSPFLAIVAHVAAAPAATATAALLVGSEEEAEAAAWAELREICPPVTDRGLPRLQK